MAKQNKTKFALLGLLSQAPMSGYDIKKCVDSSLAFFWSENYGHIYPMLKELEEEGLVTGRLEKNDKAPPKTVYSITESGAHELDAWLSHPEEEIRFRIEILLKLSFGSRMAPEQSAAKIRAHMALNQGLLARYAEVERLIAAIPDPAARTYSAITLSFGTRHSEMILEWGKEALDLIDHMNDSRATT